MRLPNMKYTDSITRQVQFKFGGYNHTPSARDGELYDMENISPGLYPMIGQRKRSDIFEGISGYIFSGVEFWMGNRSSSGDTETQYGKMYLGTELELNNLIKKGDVIEIGAGGEYSENNGQYTVNADASERNGGIYVEVSERFKVSDEYSTSPVTSGNSIKKNAVSLTIKIVSRNGEPYLDKILSVGYDGALYYVTDSGAFYYDGVYRGQLSAGEKSFAKTGNFIYILPDNAYYRISDGVIVQNETRYLKTDTPYHTTAFFYGDDISEILTDVSNFKSGDVVIVTAQAKKSGKTYTFEGTIKSVGYYSGTYTIYFTENVITKAGYTLNDITDNDGGWGWYRITVTKGIPDLKYICADSGRIWGCSENTIYCTSFSNPLGWYEYAASQTGNDADIAWSIEPFDLGEEFTGCCVYNGRPMFFSENKIYKVYGQRASEFQLVCDESPGIKKGSHGSVCVINSVLFFHSPEGIIRYSGNYGVNISQNFYETLEDAVSGSDSEFYFVTAQVGGETKTFAYSLKNGLWSIWDGIGVKEYFRIKEKLFRLNSGGYFECINPVGGEYPELFKNQEREDRLESCIVFADFYADALGKKAPSKLFFRFITEDDSELGLFIGYDGGEWEHIKTISQKGHRVFTVPVIPRRCDRFRIKITGGGAWRLHTAGYEYYVGTEM